MEQKDSLHELLARRAYQRFEERGQEHGRDIEDWFEAERELMDREDAELPTPRPHDAGDPSKD
jgi:hypothetical protein